MADDDAEKPAPKPTDVVFVGPRSDDGEGYRVLRRREDSIELGELRTPKEGKPLHGDLVRLSRREDHERLFDVEVLHEQKRPALGHAGPAQVASDAYRHNWDAIFARDPDLN